jgi:hypothetical protein
MAACTAILLAAVVLAVLLAETSARLRVGDTRRQT